MTFKKVDGLISIIMPAYNAAQYIQESIESVQGQSYTNWELLIIDDGSIDDTATIIKKKFENDNRIIYTYQANQKLGAARNTGLNLAKGEWIAFLDSDDLWIPEKLELQIIAAKKKNAEIIYSRGHNFYNETGRLTEYDTAIGNFTGRQMYYLLFANNIIPILSVLMKRNVFIECGLQDTDSKAYGCEDWDYWLRTAKHGFLFEGVEKPLFKYRIHDNGMSQNILRMRCSGFYVLSKNFDKSFFEEGDIFRAKLRITNLAKLIIIELCEQGDKRRVLYYLNESIKFRTGIEFIVAMYFVRIFKSKSLNFINRILNSNFLIRRNFFLNYR